MVDFGGQLVLMLAYEVCRAMGREEVMEGVAKGVGVAGA
jgi:hypothetical protein